MCKKVWALYRVSTEKQIIRGNEIPMQATQCHEFANKMGWVITNEITETLSGFQTPVEERESLRLIKQKAIKGEFEILLLYHSDRLGRQIEYGTWIASLYEVGVQVWSVKEGEIKSEKYSEYLINLFGYWQSERESRKTSMRVKDAMQQLNEEGFYLGGTLPFGYKLEDTGEKRNSQKDKTVKKVIIDVEERGIVELIFSLFIDKGFGGSKIASYLNENELSNRGNIWRHNTITRMLRNPIYMGYKRYNVTGKKNIKSSKRHETRRKEWKLQPFNKELQIITECTFKKVQEMMDNRSNQKVKSKTQSPPVASAVLLSEVAVCSCCGHKLRADFSLKYWKKKNGEKSIYKVFRYTCHHSRNISKTDHPGQSKFGAKSTDMKVEEMVIKTIKSIKLEAINESEQSFDFSMIDLKKKELEEVRKRLYEKDMAYKNTEEVFEKVISGKINLEFNFVVRKLEEFGKEKLELQDSVYQLENEIEEAEIALSDLNKLKHNLENWEERYQSSKTLDEKKIILNEVVKQVEMGRNAIRVTFHDIIEKILQLRTVDDSKPIV